MEKISRSTNLRMKTCDGGGICFTGLLRISSILAVAATLPPMRERGVDKPVWRPTQSGLFSVKSVYECVMGDKWNPEVAMWKLSWRRPSPHRVKTFLWLVGHGSLLTSELGIRRDLGGSNSCVKELSICEDCLVKHMSGEYCWLFLDRRYRDMACSKLNLNICWFSRSAMELCV